MPYLGCLCLYVLALLSKPTSTPLPVLMLLLDFWPLHRLSRWAVIEKLPFLAIGAASAVVTVISQGSTAAVHMPGEFSASRIPLLLCHNIVFYFQKVIWPSGLTQHYAFPEPFSVSAPAVLAGVLGTAVLLLGLLISLRWTPAPTTGWLFFFVAVFPTMGVIGFTMVIAADKYVYLPSFGFLLIVTWLLQHAWNKHSGGRGWSARRYTLVGVVVSLAIGESLASRRQLTHWRDTETLYRRMLVFAPNSPVVHSDLGAALFGIGKVDEAMAHYDRAIELSPVYAEAYYNRGSACAEQGAYERAVADFTRALELRPKDAVALNNRGNAHLTLGKYDAAIADYTAAIKIRPEYAEGYNNRGFAFGRAGDVIAALRDLDRAIELNPGYAQAYGNRAAAHFSLTHYDKARVDIDACRRLGGIPPESVVRALTTIEQR